MPSTYRNLRHPLMTALQALAVTSIVMASTALAGYYVNVQDYFPDHWQEDEIDLRDYIQQAVNENAKVYFPGGNDPDSPVLYHLSPELRIPSYRHLKFGPNHRLVRLPSRGRLIWLENRSLISGAVINGNKYAHWPEFQDLGKQGEAAIQIMGNHNRLEDVVIYDNPGHGFSCYGDYNKIYRCRAENIGYIDVQHNRRNYASRWDGQSGDGFYFRGEGNLIKDSEAYDAIRWDFCASHSGARQNTFVDCRGGDINFNSYGFIDIEQAEDNNRLIRCISPNSRIVVSVSPRTEVIQCMASHITVWDRSASIDRYRDYENISNQGILLDGNITTTAHGRIGGIAIGGYSSAREEHTPGAASPIIVNNRIYKSSIVPGHRVDWSFSVHSMDGNGIIANNILFEYESEEGERGPGMNLENIEGHNNQVVYGQWELDLPSPAMIYGQVRNAEDLVGPGPN